MLSENEIEIEVGNRKGLYLEGEKKMKITYRQGDSLNTSYFIARQGNKVARVKASDLMPLKAQRLVRAGRENSVYSPEEMISQMSAKFKSVEDFKKAAVRTRIANRMISRRRKPISRPRVSNRRRVARKPISQRNLSRREILARGESLRKRAELRNKNLGGKGLRNRPNLGWGGEVGSRDKAALSRRVPSRRNLAMSKRAESLKRAEFRKKAAMRRKLAMRKKSSLGRVSPIRKRTSPARIAAMRRQAAMRRGNSLKNRARRNVSPIRKRTASERMTAMKKRASLRRRAYDGWAIDKSEIPKGVNQLVKEPVLSINKEEAKRGKSFHPVGLVSSPKVRKYYNRLPTKSIGGDPILSVDRKSARQMRVLNSKLKDLEIKLAKKDREISQLKNRESRKVLAEKVNKVIETLITSGQLDASDEVGREEAIKKYSKLDERGLDMFLEMFAKVGNDQKMEDMNRRASSSVGNIPSSYPSSEGTKTKSDVEVMAEIWNK